MHSAWLYIVMSYSVVLSVLIVSMAWALLKRK